MNFEVFNFHPQIQKAITDFGYRSPTPIQQQAIPPILAKHDMMGLAQTGTGKSAAFVLPILQRLYSGPKGKIRALIVAPTRELAEQIHEHVGIMAAHTPIRSAVIYGGVGKAAQINKIRQGVEIIIACPGRLLDLLNDRKVNLSAVEMLVLDEADQMFDKGFLPDIRRILKNLPKQRQTLVFSATMPEEIRSLTRDILSDPITVQIEHSKPLTTISHAFYQVEQKGKTALLKKILKEKKEIATALVFTRTKHKAKSLAEQLHKHGCKATSLHGNLSQQKRKVALNGFKDGTYNILVATDIAARGIDVSNISHVINFDMPATEETYTHRTGRTGRAGCRGKAFSFVTSDDQKMIKAIKRSLDINLVLEKDSGSTGNFPAAAGKTEQRKPVSQIRKTRTANRKRNNPPSRAVSCDFGI